MIRLRVLGSIDLRDATGRELRELLVQPKRTALLAYLALGTPGRLHRRDSLLALFWPESDQEHARGALSQSLSVLRQAVGSGVVVTRGAEEVGLDATNIWCDANAFDADLAAGRYEEALAHYRDHLLAGLHAATSSAFEDWLSAERSRLLDGATRAAWALANRELHRQSAGPACSWARRALALGPCSETDLRQFLAGLHHLGDHVGVVRTYEAFTEHLRLQYDVAPSKETQELVAAVAGGGRDHLPRSLAPANTESAEMTAPPAQPDVASAPEWAPVRRPATHSRTVAVAAGLAASAMLGVFVVTSRPARVTGYTQLTTSRLLFPPAVSPLPLATDGARIYFTEFVNLHFQLKQIGYAGGEAIPIEPLGPGRSVQVLGTTADNSHVVFSEFKGLEGPLWLWPVGGGPAKRLGSLDGHAAGWSADGTTLVYMNGNNIFVANADGSGSRKLLTAPGRPYWPAFSPDGKRLRYTVFNVDTTALPALWEVSLDGTGARPLLSGWNTPPNECCGSWTTDGRHYVFQATRPEGTHLWALPNRGARLTRGTPGPIQLTSGPTNFIRPRVAPGANRLFALGWQLRGELARYDAQSGRFVPHPAALSAEWLTYTRDGKRMAYVTYPETQLWRSESDGARRLQLTVPPMRARRPQWSPDGQTIAFEAQVRNLPWKIYLVSADGGTPRPLTSHRRLESSPTWSADGASLAFALARDALSWSSPLGIRVLNLETGIETEIAGSDTVREPAWSPDGRHIAAVSRDRVALLLYDLATRRWRELARMKGILSAYWPASGEYLHFHSMPPVIDFYRVRVRDGLVERLGTLGDSRWVWGVALPWMGVAPDGSPLYLSDQSIHHLYAMDLK